jgi:hypothetical protein
MRDFLEGHCIEELGDREGRGVMPQACVIHIPHYVDRPQSREKQIGLRVLSAACSMQQEPGGAACSQAIGETFATLSATGLYLCKYG